MLAWLPWLSPSYPSEWSNMHIK